MLFMKAKKLIKTVYFVKFGTRTGQFLIFLDYDEEKEMYSILGVPESEALYMSFNDVDKAITHKVLEFVETLPNSIYEECKTEFKYRENNK